MRPNFPENFFPRDSISFSDVSNELFEIPVLVNDVLLFELSVAVDIALLGLGAFKVFALLLSEQSVAEYAFL